MGTERKQMEDIRMANDRRPDDMVRITTPELAQAFIDEQVKLVPVSYTHLRAHET